MLRFVWHLRLQLGNMINGKNFDNRLKPAGVCMLLYDQQWKLFKE